jgi:hypothetical protein
MVVRGWDSYLSVGRSPNPHGGVGTLEYRNLLPAVDTRTAGHATGPTVIGCPQTPFVRRQRMGR